MSIRSELDGAGIFAAREPIKREMEFGEKKIEVCFRELSDYETQQWVGALRSADDEKRAEYRARMIAASVVEPDGKTKVFTLDIAKRLKPREATKFERIILEINGLTQGAQEEAGNDSATTDD